MLSSYVIKAIELPVFVLKPLVLVRDVVIRKP